MDSGTRIPLPVRQNGRETTTARPLSGFTPRFLSQFLGPCPANRCMSVRSGMCRFAASERSTQLRLRGRFAADFSEDGHETATTNARVAQPVEHDVANVEVAGSRPAARFPIAAAASCEATQTTEGHSHPLATHLCGGVAARRPNRTSSHLADVARGTSLASAAVVAASGVLYSPSRVCRLASPLGRLAGRPLELRRGVAVHAADMEVGRRLRRAVAVVAAGAVLPGVPGVVA